MHKQDHLLLQLIDTVPDLMFYRDISGTFLACNLAYANYAGKDISEIIGHKLDQVLPKDEADRYSGLDRAVIKTGKPHQVDVWLKHPDGGIRLYDTIRTPLRDEEGQIVGIAGICRDITEKDRLHKLVIDEDRKYLAVLEASPDSIIVYNMQGEVDYVNPAFIETFGWALDDCKGKKMDFVPEEYWPETLANVEKIKRGESFNNFVSERLTREGKRLNVSISAAVYCDLYRKPQGSVITLRNTTQEKRIELQLQQAQKMEAVGELAGGIAHDFNNLLTAIQGHISIIQLKMDLVPLVEKKFASIEKIIARGANLTKQLLGFAHGGRYQVEILGLHQLIDDSLELFARTHKDLRITTELADDLYRIEADHSQIDQVFLNLFVNAWHAIQASQRNGHLIIEVANFEISASKYLQLPPGSYVKIMVSDNGCGMDKETQKRIFEPFFSTKQRGTGTGLGLSSVYGIVKNHGGFISVYSEKGLGSTFTIYLPAVIKDATKVEERTNTIIKGHGTILLVDDEAIVREVNEEIISALGYQVLSASTGKQALEIYKDKGADIGLVILDMIMPEMNGAEVFESLKKIDPKVKVLLASGYSVEGQAQKIMASGCNGFIQKPFTLETLSGKIDDILHEEALNTKFNF